MSASFHSRVTCTSIFPVGVPADHTAFNKAVLTSWRKPLRQIRYPARLIMSWWILKASSRDHHLGGIDVQTTQNSHRYLRTWINASGYLQCRPGPGAHEWGLALWYARSRHSTNDIDRTRRAHEVVEAIFDRLVSLDVILKAPDLYNAYITYVPTDIGLGEVLNLLPFASTSFKPG